MSTVDEGQRSSRYSRRGFLKRAAAGAGAVALSGGVGSAMAPRAVAARSATVSTSPTTFGRIFPNLPPFAAATDAVRVALAELGRRGGLLDAKDDLSKGPVLLITDPSLSANNPNNPAHTAGTTFFGQFLDHDMTFDTTSRLGVPTDPAVSPNSRTPSLDLDSVYGGRAGREPAALRPGRPRQARGRVRRPVRGPAARGRRDEHGDHRRSAQRREPDHRRPAMRVPPVPQQRGRLRRASTATTAARRSTQARQLTTWHYQWIIVHEFLPQIVGQAMVDDVFDERPPLLQAADAQGASSRSSSRRLHTGSATAWCARPTVRTCRRRRRPVLRHDLRSRRRGPGGSRSTCAGAPRAAALHRLADLLRLRRRRGEAEQANRHEDLDAAVQSAARGHRRATTRRRRCRSATCCATSPGAAVGAGGRRGDGRHAARGRRPRRAAALRASSRARRSGTTC